MSACEVICEVDCIQSQVDWYVWSIWAFVYHLNFLADIIQLFNIVKQLVYALISIIACWYIYLQYILAYLRNLEIICEIWSDWSVSIWSSLNIQLINILTQIGKLTAVYNVWTYWGIQSNRVVNHI